MSGAQRFVDSVKNRAPREASIVRGFVKSGGHGALVVTVGGEDITVKWAVGSEIGQAIDAGLVVPGAVVELSRVGGVYAARGLVQVI